MSVKFCLCEILCREAKIIRRNIDSAIGIIDAISVSCNGDDETAEIVTGYKEKVPTNVSFHPWKNFAHNRTQSFREAVRYCRDELGWDLETSYCLFLDADMILDVKDGFDKQTLKEHGYSVIQYDNSLRYANLRLARMDCPWISISVTHEYWSCPGESKKAPLLTTLEINDIGDGGSKGDKFIRDERLLTQGLIDEPGNVRYLFYLGETKYSLGKYEEAIEYYKQRIASGGWFEEIWFSHYKIAECYKKLKNYEQTVYWYLEAYNYRPQRAEALYELAKLYRQQGKNHAAYFVAEKALATSYPREDILFIYKNVYDYLIQQEISICGYYTGHRPEGFRATDFLLHKRGVTESVRQTAVRNMRFYVPKLPMKNKITLPSQLTDLDYNVMNPSLLQWQGGYLVNGRHVNYYMDKDNKYIIRDGSGVVLARNFLYHYDKNFQLLSVHELQDDLEVYDKKKAIIGMEDIRLFTWNDEVYAVPNTKLYTNSPQIALIKLDLSNWTYTDRVHLDYDHNPNVCQKNWLPLSGNGDKIRMIQSHEPLRLIDVDQKGTIEVVKSVKNENDLGTFRGSGGPLPYNGGYLGIVHEVLFIEGKRHYYHRFVWYNKDMEVIRYTLPFYIFVNGVEYVCGMSFNYEKTSVLLGVGVRDGEAHICEFDLRVIETFPCTTLKSSSKS